MTRDPARAIPILASLDIAESAAFYADQLGLFNVVQMMKKFLYNLLRPTI